MNTLKNISELSGRILLASLFVISGFGKVTAYAGTVAYMGSVGVPAALLPLVILAELGGGAAIVLGFMTRPIAIALAAFSLVTAMLFHNDFSNQIQLIMFLKNVSIAGGFLVLASHGAGSLSWDAYRAQRA